MPLKAFAFRFSPRSKHNRTIFKLKNCPLLFPGQIFHAHGLLLPQRAPVERAAERAARDGSADRAPRLHVALRRQGQGGPDHAGKNLVDFWWFCLEYVVASSKSESDRSESNVVTHVPYVFCMGQKMSGMRLHGYIRRHILHANRDEIFRHRGDERGREKREKANSGNMESFDVKFAHFRDTITLTTSNCSTLTSRLPV